jgi:hypothetical protein
MALIAMLESHTIASVADVMRAFTVSMASFLIGGIITALVQKWEQQVIVEPPRISFGTQMVFAIAYMLLLASVIAGRWEHMNEPLRPVTVLAMVALLANLAAVTKVVWEGRLRARHTKTHPGDRPTDL